MKHINKTYWGMFFRFIPLFVIALLFTVSKANADVGDKFMVGDLSYIVLTEEGSTGTVATYEQQRTGVSEVIIPEIVSRDDGRIYTVTAVGEWTFNNYYAMKSVVIPDSVVEISKCAFYNCINLNSIEITNNIRSIGDSAFSYCGLTNAVIGNSVTNIGSSAFDMCKKLKSINIPANVERLGGTAFWYCYDLSHIDLDNNRVINNFYETFRYSTNLTSIRIGNSVTNIGSKTFSKFPNLTNVVIPDSVLKIADDAFEGCDQLPLHFMNESEKILIRYSPSNTESSYTIPDTVTCIMEGAFKNCTNLINVNVSDSVTSIPQHTFENCNNLVSVTLGNNVEQIGNHAFYNCSGLKNIYIPNSVTEIQEYAFKDCSSMESITIPQNVASIKGSAFQHCSNLKDINVDPENPTYSSVDGILFNKDQTTLIKYPPGKEGEYTIPETVLHIENNAFSECKSLINLVIPEGVEVIEPYAFRNLEGLQKVEFPSTLKVIGKDAFFNCVNLKEINIPDSVISIGAGAFANCRSLEQIDISPYVEEIGDSAFFGCVNLKEINIPDSVISIGAGAFANCRSLEQIDIPPYVEEIGDSAFYRCEKLRFAYIPDSLAEVGAYMFNYCHSLESVIIGASVKEIQAGAFLNCENLNAVYFLGDHPEMDQEAFLISNYFKIIRDSQNPRLDPMTNPEVYLDALRGNTPVLYYLSDKLGWYSLSREEAINVIRSCGSWANLGNALDCCLNYTELEPNADDFDYSEGTILSYKGNSPVVVVPDSINGTAVTQIGANAFANSVGVFIIIIPGSVEAIGDNAFADCASLKTVQFRGNAPDATDNIFEGDHCVIYCESGTTGWDAVWKGVTVLSVPESSVNDFTYEINDKEVTITGYTGIATYMEIPAEIEGLSVTSIQEEAFFGRSDIFTVFVPKSVTYVGFGAFANCRNLYSVVFEGETEIEDSAFYYCRNLLEIILPKGLEEVRAYTFTGCYRLQEADLPNSLTYIGDSSFYKCTSLQDIVIPRNVTEIGDSAFAYSGVSNALLGSNVGTIGKLAFAGCGHLSNMLFGTELETIGELAFAECTDLFDVTLPQYVFEIGDRAFTGCVNLTRITMNDGLKYIGDKVFLGCASLTEITIPEGVISIGAEVFSGCESLANIWVDEKNLVFSSLDGVLFSNDQTKLIQYPIGREDEVYFIPDGVTRIADKAFQGCTKLTDVRFPDSVSTLEHYVFQYCTNLKRACFEGNAPRLKDSMYVFEGTQVTVYCHEGTSDWDIRNHSCAGRPLFVIPYLDNRLESIGLVLRWVQTDGVALQSSENGIDNWTDITEDILLDNGYCVYRITSMEEAKSFYRLIVP